MTESATPKPTYGVSSMEVMVSMPGLDFVRGIFACTLPEPPIMENVEPFDCTAETGHVVIHSIPGLRHYNPIGSVHGGYAAILLDSDNCVAEGPGFNVCIVKDGKLASPSRNALPGITRKTVFEIADAMGIEATLRDVTSHELYEADELMAVTTAGGVTPINTLDGEPVGSGAPGEMTVAIRDRFWALMDEPGPLIEAIEY